MPEAHEHLSLPVTVQISRHHLERSAWRLQRLSHSGHVFVNGRAVNDTFLAPGDQIQVGTSVLVLEVA